MQVDSKAVGIVYPYCKACKKNIKIELKGEKERLKIYSLVPSASGQCLDEACRVPRVDLYGSVLGTFLLFWR